MPVQPLPLATVPQIGAPAVLRRLKSVLPDIAARADALDAAGAFPIADVACLNEVGLLSVFAAPECGGVIFRDCAEYTDTLLTCLGLVGGANLSLGRIFEGHVNAIVLIERYGGLPWRRRLRADLADGQLYGVWNTESPPGVTCDPSAAQPILRGAKTYATGAGHLGRVVVTARLPDGRKQMLVVPVGDAPERGDPGSWRTSGMRATVSGAYDFTGMPAGADTLLGQPGDYEQEPLFTAGAWRFTAVQLGAVAALLRGLRLHLRTVGGDRDPVQRARFGRAVAAARTASLWVREAAHRAEIDAGAESLPLVLMTRGIVEDAALHVIEAVQRGIGTRAFFTGGTVDRIIRDLQLYLRQPAPDSALDRAAAHWLEADPWGDDRWW